jgi:hypothetical protein
MDEISGVLAFNSPCINWHGGAQFWINALARVVLPLTKKTPLLRAGIDALKL